MPVRLCTNVVHSVAVQYGMVLAWANNPIKCGGFAGARASRGRGLENGISHNAKLPAKALYSPAKPFKPLAIP